MTAIAVIAVFALVVSITSLGLSFYVALRDRSRLDAKSFAYEDERTGEYSSIHITATNAGRRPITLHVLSGDYEDGSRGGFRLCDAGVKLEEGGFYETKFGKFDGMMINGETGAALVNVFFEDSSGKRHKIKNSLKSVRLVRESKHPF